MEFEPGQFMELQLPGDERRRAYSLTNTANWDGEVEFLVRLHAGGYSPSTWAGRGVGDRLVAHGPVGAFGLRESGLRPRYFVAGGTGLAPMLSMLRRMSEWGEPHPALLLLGVNEEADVPRLDCLDEIRAGLPGFRTDICVWHSRRRLGRRRGDAGGRLAAALKDAAQTPDVYVCGPPRLVDAVQQVVRDAGVPAEHVVTERILPT